MRKKMKEVPREREKETERKKRERERIRTLTGDISIRVHMSLADRLKARGTNESRTGAIPVTEARCAYIYMRARVRVYVNAYTFTRYIRGPARVELGGKANKTRTPPLALSNDGLTINKSSCESRLFPSYFFPLRRANEHPTYSFRFVAILFFAPRYKRRECKLR